MKSETDSYLTRRERIEIVNALVCYNFSVTVYLAPNSRELDLCYCLAMDDRISRMTRSGWYNYLDPAVSANDVDRWLVDMFRSMRNDLRHTIARLDDPEESTKD